MDYDDPNLFGLLPKMAMYLQDQHCGNRMATVIFPNGDDEAVQIVKILEDGSCQVTEHPHIYGIVVGREHSDAGALELFGFDWKGSPRLAEVFSSGTWSYVRFWTCIPGTDIGGFVRAYADDYPTPEDFISAD
jgi:hypothetical protein